MSQLPPMPLQNVDATVAAKGGRWLFGWVLFIGMAVVFFSILVKSGRHATSLPLSDVVDQLKKGNVQAITIDGDTLRGTFVSPVALPGAQNVGTFRTDVPTGQTSSWVFTQWLLEHRNGATIQAENAGNLVTSLIVPLVPWILFFGVIWFFVFRQLRAARTRAVTPTPVVIMNPEALRQ